MPEPINYLAGMQDPSQGIFLKALQGGIQMGLQAPSALEQEKQREDINASRLNQSILQQSASEKEALAQQQKKASDYYMQVLQNPNATPDELQRAEDAVSFFNPEFGKLKEVTRKNQSALVNGFGKESAFGLYNAIRTNDPELIASEFDRYQAAADSRPELRFQSQVIRTLRDTYEKSPSLAHGLIRNAAFSADPAEFKKVWEAEGEQKKVEGGGEELNPKDFAEVQSKFAAQAKPKIEDWNTVAFYYKTAMQAAPNTAGDVALAKAYVKSLTPNESVNEGDINAIAGNHSAFADLLNKFGARITEEGSLPPKAREQIKAEIEKLAKNKKADLDKYIKDIEPTLKRAKIDPSNIFSGVVDLVDINEGKDSKPPAGALLPYDPKNKDAKRTMERLKKQDELQLPQDSTPLDMGEPKLQLISPSGIKFNRN